MKRKKTKINNNDQNKDNSENNDAQFQENQQVVNDNTMRQEENIEVVQESERNDITDANPIVKKN